MVTTVSGALASGADPISEAQRALDNAQVQPQYVPMSEFQKLQKQLADALAETRGVQGKVDRMTTVLSDFEQRSRNAEIDQWAEAVPEDRREQFKEWMGKQSPREAAQPASRQIDEQTLSFVRSAGVDPNDPRIDYDTYYNPDLSGYERLKRLTASIDTIKSGADGGKKAETPPSTAPASAPVNPPGMDATPTSKGGGYRTESDVTRAYIENRITRRQKDDEIVRLRNMAPRR